MTCDMARSRDRNAQAGPMEGMPRLFHGEGEEGGAGDPAPAGQEDRRAADDRWRGAGHDAGRSGAGKGAGAGVS